MRASSPRLRRSADSYAEAPELGKMRLLGNERFRAGDYSGASGIYEAGAQTAKLRGDARSELRFLNNLGSASLQLSRYRDAARAYLRARNLAVSLGDAEMQAATAFNLASLYLQLGETDAARDAAARGLALPPGAGEKYRPSLLIQAGLLAAADGDCAGAAGRLREAVALSRDLAGEAQAWNELGNTLLDCKQLPEAETALLEAYRLRKLSADPRLSFTYEALAELRLAQDDPRAALVLLDRAIEGESTAVWRPLNARGRARQALGDDEAAYLDLRDAARNLTERQAEVLPADAFRVRSDVERHRVYAAFVAAAGERFRSTGKPEYAEEAFAAAEGARAASLRALWTRSDGPRRLPDEYWRTRQELRRAEAADVQGVSDGSSSRLLRARLAEMEAAAGLELRTADHTESSDARRLLEAARDEAALPPRSSCEAAAAR